MRWVGVHFHELDRHLQLMIVRDVCILCVREMVVGYDGSFLKKSREMGVRVYIYIHVARSTDSSSNSQHPPTYPPVPTSLKCRVTRSCYRLMIMRLFKRLIHA